MTMIDNVERYLTFKRHLGYKFDQAARILRAFTDETDAGCDELIRAIAALVDDVGRRPDGRAGADPAPGSC